MAKTERERVHLTHPSGRFGVTVSAARAPHLQARGYRLAGAVTSSSSAAPEPIDRKALIERAKAAGVPAKGTNADLLAAVQAAEAGTTIGTPSD